MFRTKDGSQISYIDAGNPSALPVVLVHAFPLNQFMWTDQVEFLKSTYRVITFDLRGLGRSDLGAPYTLEFVVDDLIDLLDHLKISKAVVGGLSMGGYVALRAVEREPARFSGLILANTKSEADSDKAKLARYQALRKIQEVGVQKFSNDFIKAAVAPATDARAFDRAFEVSQINSEAGVSSAVLALLSRTDTTAGLEKIAVPTLVLHGELDLVIPLTAAQTLSSKIRNSKLAILPKVGHLSNLEAPEAFNQELAGFLLPLTQDLLNR